MHLSYRKSGKYIGKYAVAFAFYITYRSGVFVHNTSDIFPQRLM